MAGKSPEDEARDFRNSLAMRTLRNSTLGRRLGYLTTMHHSWLGAGLTTRGGLAGIAVAVGDQTGWRLYPWSLQDRYSNPNSNFQLPAVGLWLVGGCIGAVRRMGEALCSRSFAPKPTRGLRHSRPAMDGVRPGQSKLLAVMRTAFGD